VRAVSRAVAVLRTSVVDSGLGMGVWGVLGREVELVVLGRKGDEDGDEKEEEVDGEDSAFGDTRVISAALAAVCNLVNEVSPLREVCIAISVFFSLFLRLVLGPPPRRSHPPARPNPSTGKRDGDDGFANQRALGYQEFAVQDGDRDEGTSARCFGV